MKTKFQWALLVLIIALQAQAQSAVVTELSPCAAKSLSESVNSELLARHIDCIYRTPVSSQFAPDARGSIGTKAENYLHMTDDESSNAESLLFFLFFMSLMISYYSRFARSTK